MPPVKPTGPVPKSCGTCPAKVSINDQRISPGRSIGAPICGLKQIPLSRPGGSEKKTFDHFGRNCAQHGTEIVLDTSIKSQMKPVSYRVALPDPMHQVPTDWEREPVRTCGDCANYVPSPVTRRLTGFSAAFCRARGELILEDRLVKYAENCEKRVYARPSNRIVDDRLPSGAPLHVILMAEYDVNFGMPKPVDIQAIHKLNMSVTPLEYPTDREVTPGHKALGIRAFRKIEDPKGYGPPILLPIMNETAVDRDGKRIFSEEDVARIPRSGDPERPEKYFDHNGSVYKVMVMWTRLGQTPALWGEAGTGKTELYRHLAWMMNMPFQRISITESSEVDDLFGKMMYSPERGTYFQYGRIPKGWMVPNILTLDEPNTGQPAVWQRIRPLTDDSKQLVMDEADGLRIVKHRLCYMGMAMNPAWDPRNTGVAPLADADGSRLMHIKMDLPPEHIERQIISETLADDNWSPEDIAPAVDVLMKIASELRALSASGDAPFSWGIRNQKKVVRVKRYASWTDSFRMGVTDSLEPEIADTILQVVKSKSPD